MKKSVKVLPVVLCLISSSLPCSKHLAFASNEILERKNELKKEEHSLEKNLALLKNDQEGKEKYIKELSKQVINFEQQIELSNKEIFDSEQKLSNMEAQIKSTEAKIKHALDVLKDRIKAIETSSELNVVNVLFDSKSFPDMLEKIDAMNNISDLTRSLVDRLNTEQFKIKKDKEELENIKKQEQEQKNYLEQEKTKMMRLLEDNKEKLEDIKEKKEKVIEEQESEKNRTAMLSQAQCCWPTVNKTVTCPFGMDGLRFHTGIDIPGSYGDPIFAASSGVVIEANSQNVYGRGFGYYVLIDHGNGFITRYAHLSGIDVAVGQEVRKGQAIATMGSTGRSSCVHLHFETMKNYRCYNPLKEFKS